MFQVIVVAIVIGSPYISSNSNSNSNRLPYISSNSNSNRLFKYMK